jgi:hypothetical protein
MMRFADSLLLNSVLENIRQELASLGLMAVRADDNYYSSQIWPNTQVYMLGAEAGIAVFDNIPVAGRLPEGFNPNVPMEVGYMMGLDKEVLLLKDKYLPDMPTNLRGVHFEQFNPDKPDSVRGAVRKWAMGVFGIA